VKRINISTESPEICRLIAANPDIHSAELYPSPSNGHKYKPGETRTLVGLQSYPEYNGQQITITAIRIDGSNGKAYYVKGKINEVINWVYEYRLE
jgi:hypothetical protein